MDATYQPIMDNVGSALQVTIDLIGYKQCAMCCYLLNKSITFLEVWTYIVKGDTHHHNLQETPSSPSNDAVSSYLACLP